jgi:hypothetical protein
MYVCRLWLIAGVFLTITPAYAQGYAKDRPMVNTGHLQPTTYFHARPLVGIEDNSPIVSDWRRRPESSPLVVPIPPLPASSSGNIVVPSNAVPLGNNMYAIPTDAGSGIGASHPMLGDRRYLQPAGPRSYYKPTAVSPSLPTGTSTGVHSKMLGSPHTVAPTGGIRPAMFVKPTSNMAGEPFTAKYLDSNTSVGTASTTHTNANLTGKLLKKVRD